MPNFIIQKSGKDVAVLQIETMIKVDPETNVPTSTIEIAIRGLSLGAHDDLLYSIGKLEQRRFGMTTIGYTLPIYLDHGLTPIRAQL